MEITYIHHSSFLIESDTVYLLFDYFEGSLPAFAPNKPLVVFSSHRHGDHFSKIIFDLAKGHNDVSYVLSSDIPPAKVPKELGRTTLFLGPGEKATVKGIPIETFKSTDEGIAFILRVEGKVVYHAGDLNHWYWKGESDAWNRQMTKDYRSEVAKLPTHIDMAFVPVDGRLEEFYSLGAKDLLGHSEVNELFPMHFHGDFSTCERLAKELSPKSVHIAQIAHTNQSWRIS